MYVPAGEHLPMPGEVKADAVAHTEPAASSSAIIDRAAITARVAAVLARPTIEVRRVGKKKGRKRRAAPRVFDVRSNLRELVVEAGVPGAAPGLAEVERDDLYVLRMSLDVVEGRGAKPLEILGALGLEPGLCRVVRLETRFSHDYGAWEPPALDVPAPGAFAAAPASA